MLKLEVKPSTRDLNRRFSLLITVLKKQRWFEQILEPHLEENTSGVSWCSQLKVGWAHFLAPMKHFAELPNPKETFIRIMDLRNNTMRCFPSCETGVGKP